MARRKTHPAPRSVAPDNVIAFAEALLASFTAVRGSGAAVPIRAAAAAVGGAGACEARTMLVRC